MSRTFRLWALASALLVVGGSMLALLPGETAAAAPSGCSASYGGHSNGDSWSATEPLQRAYYDAGGATTTNNCFHVSVDKHTHMQDHERLTVKWSGAHVTGGRSLNPYGESGLPQEYPVVLMECRGVDPKDYPSGAVPKGHEAVSPDTCWTNTYFQRTNSANPGQGIWQQDASSGDNTDHIQGIDPKDVSGNCNVNSNFDYSITPFKAANGTLYPGCSAGTMPPEATVNSVSIPNEVYAFTDSDGTGSFPFEVRTSLENQSLGCSTKVPCTLEVIPIDGINCDNTDPDAACNQIGDLPPGKVNNGQAPQDAVAPAYWASASNWDRRVPVPLSFAPPPSVCTIKAAGPPVPFYGSELLSQAALQWVPAYCLNKHRFNLQANVTTDSGGYDLMCGIPKNGLCPGGDAAAAEVSTRGEDDRGIAYAPTAATGWAIGYDVDQAGNGGPATTIKLNALLLAKLLTESYPGSTTVAASHPGLATNPLSLNLDPDFIKLNPGLDVSHWSEAAATLLATSNSSQVMYELTSYIASDPRAMAFIHGKAEHDGPYTMHVNPFYKSVALPVDTWEQKDTWQFLAAPNSCLKAQGDSMPPYLPLIANPTTSMQLVAQALLYNWPNVETACTGTGTTQDPYQLTRVAPQGMGNRFMLGLVTMGDAARYGLATAELQAAPGHYVPADEGGIRSALGLAKRTEKLRPFELDQSAIRKSKTAYPGSMLVYTAAKTFGLPAATSHDVSQFIRISSSEGQRPGRGNGQLAAGYLPLTHSGVTKSMHEQAEQVADAVAAQTPLPSKASGGHHSQPPSGHHTSNPSSGGTTPGGPPGAGSPPGTSKPSTTPGKTPSTNGTTTVAGGPMVRTASVSSGTSAWLLLGLIAICLVSGIGAIVSRTALSSRGLE